MARPALSLTPKVEDFRSIDIAWLRRRGARTAGRSGRVVEAQRRRPDVLYLDEPFGALDSITRLQMRSELLRIWQAERKTILFVTHDIEESVQLADRVVVLTARPGRVRRVVPIDIPHPRDLSSARYLALRDEIFGEIGLAHRI
jgi:ABC-type nitrate/sulfonate/bicarbonate transport system ATPase subunit